MFKVRNVFLKDICSFGWIEHVYWAPAEIFNAELPEDYDYSPFCFQRFLQILWEILWTISDKILKFFTVLHWETWFFKQSDEPCSVLTC